MKIFLFLVSFTVSTFSIKATFINITGCPSLYLFAPNFVQNDTIPPCFCDNATATDDPPVAVNCFVNSNFSDLTHALTSVKKSGKKLATINVEYMAFDDNVGIPDDYFQKLGLTPSEITIVGCPNEKLTLNYTFRGLEKSLKKLTISGCNVLTIPPSLANLTSLETLNLQDTYIYTFYKHDFQGLTNLKHLDLKGNQVYQIEDGVFDDLYNVETAILGPRNSMNSSHLKEITKLRSVKTLILYNNAINELPDNALKNLKNLESLDLTANYIENITSESFAGLTNLTHLSLTTNLLKRIEDGSFRAQANLQELNLDANFVNEIWPETFQGLGSLELLNLDLNNFYVIDRATFAAMPKLKQLYLRGNKNLQYIDDDSFQGLRSLKLLNFTQSENISTITPELLKPIGMTLEQLDLSGSNLDHLTAESFQYGANIQTLSLANTQLSTLPSGVFAYLTHIQKLDLSNNKWVCDNRLAWLINWMKEEVTQGMNLVNSDQTTCWEPLEMRGTTLASLDAAHLGPYVPPSEIEQPPTTSTTTWAPPTTNGVSGNGTNDNSSSLLDHVTATGSTATTSRQPQFGEPSSVKKSSGDDDSRKIKIIIAVVASVVSAATIAVVVIVVLVMRKRKRKQNEQNRKTDAHDVETARPRPGVDTEMTTHINATNGAAQNGNPKPASIEETNTDAPPIYSRGTNDPPPYSPAAQNAAPVQRHKSTSSDEVQI